MSYDRVWLCPSLNRGTWIESGDPKFHEESSKFGTYDVRVSAGENLIFDELYCFLTLGDAQQFYEVDVAGRECIDEHQHAFGFQEISLIVNGKEIATR